MEALQARLPCIASVVASALMTAIQLLVDFCHTEAVASSIGRAII